MTFVVTKTTLSPGVVGRREVVEGEPEYLVEAGEEDMRRGAAGGHPPHLRGGVRVHLTRLLGLEVGRLHPTACQES